MGSFGSDFRPGFGWVAVLGGGPATTRPHAAQRTGRPGTPANGWRWPQPGQEIDRAMMGLLRTGPRDLTKGLLLGPWNSGETCTPATCIIPGIANRECRKC